MYVHASDKCKYCYKITKKEHLRATEVSGQNFSLGIDISLFLDLLLYCLPPSPVSHWSPI